MKQHMAESALNRLLNFLDDLGAPPIANSAATGAAIDAALVQPTPAMPPADAIADATVLKGLGIAPTH